MTKLIKHVSVAALTLAVSACGSSNPYGLPSGAFWDELAALCGNPYEGKVTTNYSADRDWKRDRLILDVAECSADGVVINFNRTDDRTRIWTITPQADGAIGYHISRTEGAGPPGIGTYGGISTAGADAMVQVFPIDEESRAMFEGLGIMLSTQNVWTLTVDPEAQTLSYHVQRIDSERGMEFDISAPVPVGMPESWEPVEPF